jgi:molecular chaperone HtpG
VLLLTDHVDDFWVNVAPEFKGKSLMSVTRSNIELDALEEKSEEKKNDDTTSTPDMDTLITALKTIYGDAVKDVRITHKLSESAVCLAVEEGAMDIRLERFLREQKQISTTYAKILEINPKNQMIQSLAKRAANKEHENDATFKDVVFLLLDQAKIAEGEEVSDSILFSERINRLLSKAVA